LAISCAAKGHAWEIAAGCQRELKIKATYIAAIENADLSAFETPVRRRLCPLLCPLSGDGPGMGLRALLRRGRIPGVARAFRRRFAAADRQGAGAVGIADPLGDPNASFIPRGEAIWSGFEPGALGSIAVLVALIGAIGYGGWSVLQEVQRVQLAPVDQAPTWWPRSTRWQCRGDRAEGGGIAPVEPATEAWPAPRARRPTTCWIACTVRRRWTCRS
jgi:hypothetical protein